MKIVRDKYPPFYENIRLVLGENDNELFTYGDTIYAPYLKENEEIPADILEHEKTHSERQGERPDAYIHQYLMNREFRKNEEVIAYAHQVRWVNENLGAKAAKDCLDEAAENLASPMYKLDLTKHKAHSLIRHYIKKYGQ